jgi:DeoR/GlpR family transcriptional regulator of sugar metabolism
MNRAANDLNTPTNNATMPTLNSKERCATEEEIEEAVNAVRKRIFRTAYEAEQKFGVSRSTIRRQLEGLSQSPRLAHVDEKLLSKREE